eukprot:NODE_4106_length_862_cov_12.396064_g3788_i0.p1 GENE.NODE_4106_length_862_cov_12.396064_g3788_i0~~NODE_4106_length_862_cov_12.396064_g3788_i0.p1  ORF type:complete len:245 (-),score=51.74 NODE_4106_length_862_cov_12.396064_g3788_i0:127-756(-)
MEQEWIRNYEAATELAATIAHEIEYPKGRPGEMRRNMRKLESEIGDLKVALVEAKMPPREIQRRKQLLVKLQERRDELELRSQEKQGKGNRRHNDPVAETADSLALDNTQLLQQQRNVIDRQDKDLDSLHDTVLRTKNIGLMIGNELNEHDRLLGTLENEVETTTSKIQNERRRLDKLIEKNKGRFGLCAVCILILVLLVLLLFVFKVL